jgi:peptidoglycan/xylan/chitin deacetylase (PgdA/CDA1 family)
MVVATAVVVVVMSYATGNLWGRSTDLTPSPKASPQPTGVAAPPPTAGGAVGANWEASVPIAPAAAQARPVTGPGRPPLSHRAGGPHGTHRTTGADYVALTFDDGPDPQWTPEVLALLRKHRVKATFCVVGQLVEAFPELVREIAEAGHTLCNHSWDHDFGLGSRSRTEIRENLERTNAAIHRAAPGTRISYYRQPGGFWTDRVVEVAAELGMSSLHWAVDPRTGASRARRRSPRW